MKRDWAPAYTLRKATLTNDELRRSLELAEEAISVDPFHHVERLEVDGVVFDANERGSSSSIGVESDGRSCSSPSGPSRIVSASSQRLALDGPTDQAARSSNARRSRAAGSASIASSSASIAAFIESTLARRP